MERNNIIILVLIIIAVALLLGIMMAVMPNMGKQDTILKFKGDSTLTEGDYIKFKLTDANGTALANQELIITVKGADKSSDRHSVVTNSKGVGKLKMDSGPGEYKVTVSYKGNDSYNACNTTKKVTVEEEVVEAETNYDPGAFYSEQAGRVIYTGEIQDAPDGHKWKHLGYNEWVKVD